MARCKSKPAAEPRAEPLVPGVYRLKCDTPNPKPDRRSREWYAKPVWEQGLIFFARAVVLPCPGRWQPRTEHKLDVGYYSHESFGAGSEQYAALAANLERLPYERVYTLPPGLPISNDESGADDVWDRVNTILRLCGCVGGERVAEKVLVGLAATGKVTLPMMMEAYQHVEKSYAADPDWRPWEDSDEDAARAEHATREATVEIAKQPKKGDES